MALRKCPFTSRSNPPNLGLTKFSRPDKNYKTQRLLLGTHTNDEDPNYIMIASVQLPKDNQDIDLRKYEESTNGKYLL